MESLLIQQHTHSRNLDNRMNLIHVWKPLLTHSFILFSFLSLFCQVCDSSYLISVLVLSAQFCFSNIAHSFISIITPLYMSFYMSEFSFD